MKKLPLLVHFVFHPDSDSARRLAIGLHRSLNHDASVPGLDIPTTFCNYSDQSPPANQGLDRAERSFVVVLADEYLVAGENAKKWQGFVADIWRETQGSVHRFVPLQLSSNAWGFNDELNAANVSFGRAFQEMEADKKLESVTRVVTIELIRFLSAVPIGQGVSKAPVQFFLSHAKADLQSEFKAVTTLIDTLKADQPIESWVDAGNIPPGSNFAQEIENGIKTSSFLSVLTDQYSTREWCRTEVLMAKEHQRPIVVLDALEQFEVRSFPYLGNVPVIRWIPGRPYRAIDLLLKETVRQHHTRLRLEQWREESDVITVRAPELATIRLAISGKTLLYPDPPLGSEETKMLRDLNIRCTTPLERMAQKRSLDGKRVAISMSESSDIERYSFSPAHLDNSILELSRYLAIQGAELAYGGHLGEKGYTERLFDLVRSHNQIDRTESIKPIVNYIGWPLPKPNVATQADFLRVGSFRRVGRPNSIDENVNSDLVAEPVKFFHADISPLHRLAWSLGMTNMRQVQTSETCARVVLGGKTDKTVSVQGDGTRAEKWYMSRIPGLLEEVYLSAKAGQPVFLIGAYGGAAAMVIDLIEGKDRAEATWEFQKAAPHAKDLPALYAKFGIAWESYEDIIAFLRQKGVAGINPLLSEEENRELFRTIDLMRMVELVVSGLSKA